MKGLCERCKNKTCLDADGKFINLCPEAEVYVNQDYVSQKETPIGFAKSLDIPPINPPQATSSNTKKQIVRLHLDGKIQKDIAVHVGCSQQYVSKVLRKLGYRG